MWECFDISVPGKWVLAGEHAVLRGATAVALPHPSMKLRLKFEPRGSGLNVLPQSAETVIRDLLRVVEDECAERDLPFPRPEGELVLESGIPMGAGMGSSAALCVAFSSWVKDPLSLHQTSLLELATQLEHRFHGRSSGMDTAVILAGEPIAFTPGRGALPLGLTKLPAFTFHDTGLRSRTSDCILAVESLREDRPIFASQIDERMGAASRRAMDGLIRFDLGEVALAMSEAQECFRLWGLVPEEALDLVASLKSQGALSAKLTGAGGGGMVVALWPD